MGAIEKVLVDHFEGRCSITGSDVMQARAEIAEKDARIARLTVAIARLVNGPFAVIPLTGDDDRPLVHPDVACDVYNDLVEALSGTPTTARLVPVEKLRDIEWCIVRPGDAQQSCPACDGDKPWYGGRMGGHAQDCWLAALLREETRP